MTLITREATAAEWARHVGRIGNPQTRAFLEGGFASLEVDGVRLTPPGGVRAGAPVMHSAPLEQREALTVRSAASEGPLTRLERDHGQALEDAIQREMGSFDPFEREVQRWFEAEPPVPARVPLSRRERDGAALEAEIQRVLRDAEVG